MLLQPYYYYIIVIMPPRWTRTLRPLAQYSGGINANSRLFYFANAMAIHDIANIIEFSILLLIQTSITLNTIAAINCNAPAVCIKLFKQRPGDKP